MPRIDLIQIRRAAAADWTAVNPVLASGELGGETDTGQIKVGNGGTAWNALAYPSDASHTAAADPHPAYLTAAEGNAAYAPALVGGKGPVRDDELVLDAAKHGVSPGNTAAANTTALNALGTLANSIGAMVQLPRGIIDLTSWQLPVPATRVGLTIRGNGVGRTILRGTTAAPMVIVGAGGVLDAQNVTLEDITFDANGVATDCVKHNHTRFLRVARCDLRGATGQLVNIVGGVANYFAAYEECRFFNAPVLVYVDGGAGIGGNSNSFDHCHFSGATGTYNGVTGGVSVAINGGDSNIFRDCEFIGSGTTGVYLHNSAVGNKILGNQFDGPATAVNCATVGVVSTIIGDNTGTVVITDLGAETVFRQGRYLSTGSGPLIVGGLYARTNVTPMIVKAAAGATTDVFRVENSAAAALFRVDQAGNLETGSAALIVAHGHSTFDNAAANSISLTVKTSASPTAKALRVQGATSGGAQTGHLASYETGAGVILSAVTASGAFRTLATTTALRPSASTVGAGAMVYDTTLARPVWSDGTVWRDSAGAAV